MKRKPFFDTSVVIAALVREHPNHAAAASLLNETFRTTGPAFISAHSLAEVYAVLTRAPAPLLVSPGDAWQMINSSLLPHFEVVALTGDEHREVIEECARHGWAGGRIYDLVHIRAAIKAGCKRLYTFNVKHFRSMAPEALLDRITAP